MPAGRGSNSDNMESQSSALQGYLNDSTSIFPSVWELDSQMQDFIWQTHEGGMSWFSLIDAAIWLAAILGLLSLAVTAYKVALRQGRLDILQLLRPLFIVLALTGYFAVAKSITSLVSGVEGSFRNNYIINANAAHAAKKQRDKLQADLISEARQLQASSTVLRELKVTLSNEDTSGEQEVTAQVEKPATTKEILSSQGVRIYEASDEVMAERVVQDYIESSWINRILDAAVVWLGEFFWQLGAFVAVLSKDFALCVLVFFGPVVIACCMLERWKDAWLTWIGHLVVISLYGAAIYMVMSFCCWLMCEGYQMEVSRLSRVLDPEVDNHVALLVDYMKGLGSMGSTSNVVLLTQLLGFIVLMKVSALAGMMFPGGGNSAVNGIVDGLFAAAKGAVYETADTTRSLRNSKSGGKAVETEGSGNSGKGDSLKSGGGKGPDKVTPDGGKGVQQEDRRENVRKDGAASSEKGTGKKPDDDGRKTDRPAGGKDDKPRQDFRKADEQLGAFLDGKAVPDEETLLALLGGTMNWNRETTDRLKSQLDLILARREELRRAGGYAKADAQLDGLMGGKTAMKGDEARIVREIKERLDFLSSRQEYMDKMAEGKPEAINCRASEEKLRKLTEELRVLWEVDQASADEGGQVRTGSSSASTVSGTPDDSAERYRKAAEALEDMEQSLSSGEEFVSSPVNGRFARDDKGKRIYRVTRTDATHATYEFADTPDALSAARRNRQRFVDTACDSADRNTRGNGIAGIRTVVPGRLELRDGQWAIIMKARIEIVSK